MTFVIEQPLLETTQNCWSKLEYNDRFSEDCLFDSNLTVRPLQRKVEEGGELCLLELWGGGREATKRESDMGIIESPIK